jgi:hypothetical protein
MAGVMNRQDAKKGSGLTAVGRRLRKLGVNSANVRVVSDSRGGSLRIAAAFRIAKEQPFDKLRTKGHESPARRQMTFHQQSVGFATGRDRSVSGRVVPLSPVKAVGWGNYVKAALGLIVVIITLNVLESMYWEFFFGEL